MQASTSHGGRCVRLVPVRKTECTKNNGVRACACPEDSGLTNLRAQCKSVKYSERHNLSKTGIRQHTSTCLLMGLLCVLCGDAVRTPLIQERVPTEIQGARPHPRSYDSTGYPEGSLPIFACRPRVGRTSALSCTRLSPSWKYLKFFHFDTRSVPVPSK